MANSSPESPLITLQRLAQGHHELALLTAADELGLFVAIHAGANTPAAAADAVGAPVRGVERVIRALVGLNHLVQEGDGTLVLGDLPAQCLLPDAPFYLGDLLQFTSEHVEAFHRTAEAVRKGEPLAAHDSTALSTMSPEGIHAYVHGLYNIALGTGRMIAGMVDLAEARNLLDVGGGSGAYSILLCETHPALTATVFELPPILTETRKILERHGMQQRVHMAEGDYHTDDFGGGYDTVFFSHIFQTEGETVGRMLMRKAFAALEPGGRLIVHGMMADPGGTSPRPIAVFGMLMFLLFPEGQPHSAETLRTWAEDAGFTAGEVLPLPPPMPSRLLCLRKPA